MQWIVRLVPRSPGRGWPLTLPCSISLLPFSFGTEIHYLEFAKRIADCWWQNQSMKTGMSIREIEIM